VSLTSKGILVQNVIDFPVKVFRSWGANAQALGNYLAALGATKSQTREIVDRLKVEWERSRLPLCLPQVYYSYPPQVSEVTFMSDVGVKYHSREIPLRRGTARTLLEMAAQEFARVS